MAMSITWMRSTSSTASTQRENQLRTSVSRAGRPGGGAAWSTSWRRAAGATGAGSRPDQERAPRLPTKDPAGGGEERRVGRAVYRPLHLPVQDRHLVSQHGDLNFRLGRHSVVRTDQAEDPAQEEIEEGPDHSAALSQTGPPLPVSYPRSSFWTRRGWLQSAPDNATHERDAGREAHRRSGGHGDERRHREPGQRESGHEEQPAVAAAEDPSQEAFRRLREHQRGGSVLRSHRQNCPGRGGNGEHEGRFGRRGVEGPDAEPRQDGGVCDPVEDAVEHRPSRRRTHLQPRGFPVHPVEDRGRVDEQSTGDSGADGEEPSGEHTVHRRERRKEVWRGPQGGDGNGDASGDGSVQIARHGAVAALHERAPQSPSGRGEVRGGVDVLPPGPLRERHNGERAHRREPRDGAGQGVVTGRRGLLLVIEDLRREDERSALDCGLVQLLAHGDDRALTLANTGALLPRLGVGVAIDQDRGRGGSHQSGEGPLTEQVVGGHQDEGFLALDYGAGRPERRAVAELPVLRHHRSDRSGTGKAGYHRCHRPGVVTHHHHNVLDACRPQGAHGALHEGKPSQAHECLRATAGHRAQAERPPRRQDNRDPRCRGERDSKSYRRRRGGRAAHRRTIGHVSVRVIPPTAWIRASTSLPRASMVPASTRAMTSYGPVTTWAEIAPVSFVSSALTEAALPVSVWISTYACTTWHRLQ